MKLKKFVLAICALVLLSSVSPASPASATSYDGTSGTVDCTSGGTVLIENNAVVSRTQYISMDYGFGMDYGYDQRIPSDCSGSVVIPEGVTGISGSAFQDATALTSISLPSTLITIDSWAFYNANSLTSITIPANVTSIGGMVFGNTNSLTSIAVDSANQNYSSISGVLFNKDATRLLKYPAAKSDTSYVIPNGVTVIDYSAANQASALTSLTIPASVTLIAYFSFEYARSLKDVYFLGNAPTVEYGAFSDVASGAKAYIKSGSTGYAAIGNSWNGLTVAAAPTTYAVTFNSKSGSAVSAGSFVAAGSVAAPTAPTRSGYTFAGWSATDGGSLVEFPYSPGVAEDITLYAKWVIASHTVTFNSKGGSAVSSGSFVEGQSFEAPSAPTRSGYTFTGWSATDGGSSIVFPYSPGVITDVTLYALWSADSHTVTFNSKLGTAVSAGVFATDGSLAAPTAPTRSGYTFTGWSATDGGSVVSFPYTPGVITDVTLYALWSADSHTVTFNSKLGTAVSAGVFATDGSLAAPTAPTRSGYTFTGWSATDGGSAVVFPYSPGVSEAITLYAKWSINTYVVTLNSKGGTSIAVGSFVYGGSIATSPKVPYRLGAVFVGWSATEGGSAVSFPYSPGVASNVTLFAKWTVLPPVLSTSNGTALAPGDLVMVNVSRVNQGCMVSVRWTELNSGVSAVSRVVRADRSTGVFEIATPAIAGSYTLSTNRIGSECSGGSAVTLAKTFLVGKSSSILAKVTSSSAYVSKSPTVSVSGSVKAGSVAVASKQVTVSLRRNGVEVASASGSTNSSGVFNVSLPSAVYVAGDYTAVVTVIADSIYRTTQITTTKLTLR